MKKIFSLLVCLAMCACIFASCEGAEETAAETTKAATTAAADAATTKAPETTAAPEITNAPEVTDAPADASEAAAKLDVLLGDATEGDIAALSSLLGYPNEFSETADLSEIAIFSKISYTIGEATLTDDENAVVTVNLSVPDTAGIDEKYYEEYLNNMDAEGVWDEDGTIYAAMIAEADLELISGEVDVNMVKVDGAWTVSEDNPDFTFALLGIF